MTGPVPERLRWAVRTLAVGPAERLLEIGCGTGVAVALVGDALSGGTISGIDRSAKMIAAAERRNAERLAAGTVTLRTVALEGLAGEGDPFDKIFAVNVNLFWVRRADREIAVLSRLLRPGGALYLFYEPPTAEQVAGIARTVAAALDAAGLATSTSTASTGGSALLCVKGIRTP